MDLILFLVGLAVGGAIGGTLAWYVASVRARTAALSRTAEAEQRASAAEAMTGELRTQAEKTEQALASLQQRLKDEQEARVRAETQLAEAAKNLEEQKLLLRDAEARLVDTFKALSADALNASTDSFLKRASESLEPFREKLTSYEKILREIESSRNEAYGALKAQVQSLSRETRDLSNALRNPQVRGRWGEVQLERLLELAGVPDHCVRKQVSVDTPGGRLRPDMVIQLPTGREIVVDSKVPLDAYLKALETESHEARQEQLAQHARQVRQHMEKLSQKAYWEEFPQAPEYVVMFIPRESFLGAALEVDPTLLEDGMKRNVVLATPTILFAMLHTVARGWREVQLARNAQEIQALGKDLYDRMRTLAEHFDDLRKALGKATEAYNSAVASLESRVFPAARRFRDLGVTTAEIPAVEPLDSVPRRLSAPEPPAEGA